MARKFTRKRWRRPQRLTLEGPPPARRKDVVVIDTMTLEPALQWHDNRRRLAAVTAGWIVLSAIEGLIVGLVLGMPWLVLAFVGLSALYLLAGLRLADVWTLSVLHSSDNAPPRVRAFVAALAEQYGAPPPRVLVCPGEAPNAIAVGLARRAIVMTSGALRLPDLEQEALLAHELVHVQGGDAALSTMLVLLGGAVELGTKGLRSPSGVFALLALPLWPVSLVVRAATNFLVPDDREARADVGGALLTRYPPGMRRLLLSASVEQSDSTLRVTDAFWTAPRVPERSAWLHARAERVGEM